jgi:hypothetical protein
MTHLTTKLAIAAGLIGTVAFASPSFAQSTKGAFAQSPARTQTVVAPQRRGSVQSNDVYQNGHYVGADPDPFIRSQLQNDTDHFSGSSD